MEQKQAKSRGFLDFIKAKGRLWLLIGGAVLGILLLLLSSGIGSESTSDQGAVQDGLDVEYMAAYEKEIEARLETLCESVSGVGQAEIMVRLAEGYRTVYATDADQKPVTVGSGSNQRALPEAVTPPTVAGVGVVCRGGNDPSVQQRLTELISTTLGIPSNRVFVTGK